MLENGILINKDFFCAQIEHLFPGIVYFVDFSPGACMISASLHMLGACMRHALQRIHACNNWSEAGTLSSRVSRPQRLSVYSPSEQVRLLQNASHAVTRRCYVTSELIPTVGRAGNEAACCCCAGSNVSPYECPPCSIDLKEQVVQGSNLQVAIARVISGLVRETKR